eukprot:TRINITY_DN14291_c0_g1_i1.p1 TRINITY_DN14291_c0_g1~~TRINITY_DN14291_c0_g1_i1.p1  ORF type:complete len:291 (-),score=38.84 TRINITY_DN14291_c0_g1_i1:366-1238(-)
MANAEEGAADGIHISTEDRMRAMRIATNREAVSATDERVFSTPQTAAREDSTPIATPQMPPAQYRALSPMLRGPMLQAPMVPPASGTPMSPIHSNRGLGMPMQPPASAAPRPAAMQMYLPTTPVTSPLAPSPRMPLQTVASQPAIPLHIAAPMVSLQPSASQPALPLEAYPWQRSQSPMREREYQNAMLPHPPTGRPLLSYQGRPYEDNDVPGGRRPYFGDIYGAMHPSASYSVMYRGGQMQDGSNMNGLYPPPAYMNGGYHGGPPLKSARAHQPSKPRDENPCGFCAMQ